MLKKTHKNGNGNDTAKLEAITETLIEAFGLSQSLGGPILGEWLDADGQLDEWQTRLLDEVYAFSVPRVRGWNEEELKMKLLSPLFLISDLESDGQFSTFFDRPLSATIGKHKLSVVCDCLLAKPFGLTKPRAPYFFLQEFKRRKSESDDPEGQMLAAMLIAQQENPSEKPVYGCWIQGNIWTFTALKGKDYFFSKSFDTLDKNDLLKIVFVLRKLRALIT